MDLASLLSQLRRSFKVEQNETTLKLNLESDVAAGTIPVDRPLSEQELAIGRWLLMHSDPPVSSFIPQLDVARVTGHCGCGCPTVHLSIPQGTERAEPRDNPIGEAIGEVDGKMVGVMLLQRDGHLTCLEIYDLSEIEHPYGLPSLDSLRPFEAQSGSRA
jgi:hypothetical protein